MAHEPEDFITVEEAAERLRIGRSRAYLEARLYIATGGAQGIVPAMPVGRLYRVSVARLEEMAGGRLRSFHRADKDTGSTSDVEAMTKQASSDEPTGRRPRRTIGRTNPAAPRLFDI
ncbi:MAG: helix-turn-helix domain-containing protein [Acidimicrobiia bacterium]|nr:helix-turn-helix domain-containing protein [Acidimicrobiia bacterium]